MRLTMAESIAVPSSVTIEDTSSDNLVVDLDSIHGRLLSYNDVTCVNAPEDIPELPIDPAEIQYICNRAKELICKEPSLLELDIGVESNLVVIGTLRGNLSCLVNILETFGHPPKHSYLFLGNVIGDNRCSLAVITLIIVLKLKFPNHVHVLRGQNESGLLIKANLFFRQECGRKYHHGVTKAFRYLFHSLPFAAVVSRKIFCVSGGLSPVLNDLKQISTIQRPIDCPSQGLRCDLLWSSHDSEAAGWAEADKSLLLTSMVRTFKFGGEIVSRFLVKNNFDLMCCAAGYKEYVPGGFQFSAWKQRVTLLSTPVKSVDIFSNGAVLLIDDELNCSFGECTDSGVKMSQVNKDTVV